MNTWGDTDFEKMSWHDCIIHSISFPSDNLLLKLDIDYILEWKLIKQTNLYQFKVAPALLVFKNVLGLKIDLDFEQYIGLYINNITRKNKQLCPDNESYDWDYEIETDRGKIVFNSSGFIQTLKAEPQTGNSQIFEK